MLEAAAGALATVANTTSMNGTSQRRIHPA
jgi:hypothetical protein